MSTVRQLLISSSISDELAELYSPQHCFIISNNQLNAILSNIALLSVVEKTQMVRNLVTLNILAYNQLYPKEPMALDHGSTYRYTEPTTKFTALESLKLLDCLEFNIASLKDHEEFPDFKRIAALKSQLIKGIAGYAALRWTIK